jgi:N-formylglutamate amidohydrolase
MIPLIAHIPHSRTAIPADLRVSFKLNDAELEREIFQLTDWCVDELFSSVEEMGGISVRLFRGEPSSPSGIPGELLFSIRTADRL